ncbi:MAG: hypothetical protein MUE53_03445 [Chitinophagales bacterium]|nr:hypothetical protein [Chitinophagales bacterium]
MKNTLIFTILSILSFQSYSQAGFSLGFGNGSSTVFTTSTPLTMLGLTNNGNFTQNSNSTFNGNITQSSGDFEINTGNLELTSPNSKADLKGDFEVGKDSKFKGNTEFNGANCFKGDTINIFEGRVGIGMSCGSLETNAKLHITDGSILSTDCSGKPIPVEGPGVRMMWYDNLKAINTNKIVNLINLSENLSKKQLALSNYRSDCILHKF